MTEEGRAIADAATAARISKRLSYRWLVRYQSGGGLPASSNGSYLVRAKGPLLRPDLPALAGRIVIGVLGNDN